MESESHNFLSLRSNWQSFSNILINNITHQRCDSLWKPTAVVGTSLAKVDQSRCPWDSTSFRGSADRTISITRVAPFALGAPELPGCSLQKSPCALGTHTSSYCFSHWSRDVTNADKQDLGLTYLGRRQPLLMLKHLICLQTNDPKWKRSMISSSHALGPPKGFANQSMSKLMASINEFHSNPNPTQTQPRSKDWQNLAMATSTRKRHFYLLAEDPYQMIKTSLSGRISGALVVWKARWKHFNTTTMGDSPNEPQCHL